MSQDIVTITDPKFLERRAGDLENLANLAMDAGDYRAACRLAARANRLRGIANGRENR